MSAANNKSGDLEKDLPTEQQLVDEYGFTTQEAEEASRLVRVPTDQRSAEDAQKLRDYTAKLVQTGFAQIQSVLEKK